MEKNRLDFLAIQVNKHPLIKKDSIFSTLATSRVYGDNIEDLTCLKSRLYRNNIIALTGRNATGKTTVLRLLIGLLQLTLNGKAIGNTELSSSLFEEDDIDVSVFFYASDNKIYKDNLLFSKNEEDEWYIKKEIIFVKKISSYTTKKNILKSIEKDNFDSELDREHLGDTEKQLLSSDISLFKLVSSKYETQNVYHTLKFTDSNRFIYNSFEVPSELLEFLDPTIEYVKAETIKTSDLSSRISYKLKFKNRDQIYSEVNFFTLSQYLSSGTIKGITLYIFMIRALLNGGMLFVDELENHFNHTIIREILAAFFDKEINKHGATLIFTTHFSELLQDIPRTDNIYIMEREEEIEIKKYSDLNIRTELDKQEVFDSGYNMKSVPSYQAVENFEKALRRVVNANE